MTVRVNKDSFNLREKLSELERPIGLKGSELMKSETVQEARDFVSAGRKNLIINGSFLVSQRATSVTRSSASTAMSTVDRFSAKFYGSGWGSNHSTESQSTDAPPGHSYSYKVLANVVQSYSSALGSWIQYSFEGNQLLSLKTKDLGYKAFTISFWIKSNKTGYVSFSSETAGQGHSFSTAVQINTAGVWEYKTVTVPASPSSQLSETEFRSTDSEFSIKWGLGSNGAWLVGTDDSWQPVATNRGVLSPLQTNFQAAQNDYLAISGIQLERGRNATEFEHRSYGEELALCQRYCQSFNGRIGIGNWNNGTSALVVRYLNPPMRIAPSIHSYTAGNCLVEAIAWYSVGSVSIQGETTNTSVVFSLNSISNSGQGANANAMWGNGASVVLQAEL